MLTADVEAAVVVLQRMVRGWLVRKKRAAGELFPVEMQAMADAKVLMLAYGASVYSLSPVCVRVYVYMYLSGMYTRICVLCTCLLCVGE